MHSLDKVFIEHILCSRHCAGSWGYSSEESKQKFLPSYSLKFGGRNQTISENNNYYYMTLKRAQFVGQEPGGCNFQENVQATASRRKCSLGKDRKEIKR